MATTTHKDTRKIPTEQGDITVGWQVSGDSSIHLETFVSLADNMIRDMSGMNQPDLFSQNKEIPLDAVICQEVTLVSDKPKSGDKNLSARIEIPLTGSEGKVLGSQVYNLSQQNDKKFKVILIPVAVKKEEDEKAEPKEKASKTKSTSKNDPDLKLAEKIHIGDLCPVGVAAKLEEAGIKNARLAWESGVDGMSEFVPRDAAEDVYREAAKAIDALSASKEKVSKKASKKEKK